MKGIEQSDDIKNPYEDIKELKLKKMNKTHWSLNGLIKILRDDIPRERLLYSLRGATKKGNGYSETSLFQWNKLNYCEIWCNEPLFMPSVRASINYTGSNCCPYPVGTYAMVDFIPDTSKLPSYIPEKYWRFEYLIHDLDTIVCRIKVYIELEPVLEEHPKSFTSS
ncbi:uncharacterized protein LOC123290630 [Chrysoperla carnea]|uniref:uncharacterized protein LOC123290630 n=1 Tax=Chrysoperla carnea TaxID=189513 RepID=UPI001D068877|nr:uncharacterized protein LOC123290630 [Chrysoperla carnea]